MALTNFIPRQTLVTAEWLNKVDGAVENNINNQNIVTVDAITAVNATALGLVDGDMIQARGRTTAGDGGGGTFRYIAASTQTADGGVVFQPTAGGGRLFRDGWTVAGFNGDVFARWFGAAGSGSVNDQPGIQAALDCLATGSVRLGAGNFRTDSVVTLSRSGQSLIGDGRNATLILANFRGDAAIKITAARCTIKQMNVSTLFGSSRRNASSFGKTAPDPSVDGISADYGIFCLQGASSFTYTRIEQVDVTFQPGCGIYMAGDGTGSLIDQCGVSFCGGHGILADNGTYIGQSLTRIGIVTIASSIIQECWGDGILIGNSSSTAYRFILQNLDVFQNAKGDGGTFQPAFYSGGGQIEACCENLTIDTCAVGNGTNGINIGVSNAVSLSNVRIIDIVTRGVLINPSCTRVDITNIEASYVGAAPTTGIRVQTGCTNVRIQGMVSSEWGNPIDSESEARVLIDNRDALTVPGSNSLFYLSGTVSSTISAGALNVQGASVLVAGEGGVVDSCSSLRFVSGVNVPDGYRFTLFNLNAYNITLQDRTVLGSGNIELQGANAVLEPNESLQFMAMSGVYYAIGREVP